MYVFYQVKKINIKWLSFENSVHKCFLDATSVVCCGNFRVARKLDGLGRQKEPKTNIYI